MRYALALLALAGCDAGPTACTMEFVYGLTVEARDAETGAPLGDGTVVARDGAYEETLEAWPEAGVFVGAGERAGTYAVTASAPGYAPWTGTARVTAGPCHVRPVRLTAALQPE